MAVKKGGDSLRGDRGLSPPDFCGWCGHGPDHQRTVGQRRKTRYASNSKARAIRTVIPAKAGISLFFLVVEENEIPAFAGM